MDRISTEKRSALMGRIRSKDTTPELITRKLVHSLGYRYRLHSRDLPGKPDLVFRHRKKVIFVHGCFWHQHKGCADSHIPKSNVNYWKPKLEKTKKRDLNHQKQLISGGWAVFVVWACELKDLKKVKKAVISFLES